VKGWKYKTGGDLNEKMLRLGEDPTIWSHNLVH